MPTLCNLYDLYTSTDFCFLSSGVKRIRLTRTKDIDFDRLNSDLDTYYNKETQSFIKSIPLKDSKIWGLFEHEYRNANRQSIGVQGKYYYDTSLNELTFSGYLDSKKVSEIKGSSLVTVSQLQNGVIIVDGLEYDNDEGKIVITKYLPLQFSEMRENSSIFFDEYGINTVLNIAGRQENKGMKGLFSWDTMNEGDYGIYVADSLFAFMTDDNSLFSFL